MALIENSSKINLTGDLTNTANTNIKQITGVVGASVATGSEKSSNAFNGVVAYSKLENTAKAKVDSSTFTAPNLINRAFDGEISNTNVDYLEGTGIDTKGADFLKNMAEDSKAADSNVGTMSTNSTGNLQIVGAFDLIVSTGNKGGAGLVAVTIGDIDNDFNSIIKNSKIAGNVDADALSNSLAVNAAGGVAVSNGGFGGAGSASWQTTDNQVKAAIISDSENTVTGNVDLNAISKAREVSVAGELGVSKGTAIGLAMAYNNLNLTTETELKNIKIEGTNIKTTSKNDGTIYAIGAGINASKGTAINGSAAINYGTNSATSKIENVTAENAKTLETTATDETYRLAIGGGANIGKNNAAGGAVVYNDIGTSSKNQQTKLTVNNSKFENLQAATIKTEDNSTLKSIAAQLSGSGNVAATGAAAVSKIYKDVGNSITNSTFGGKISADSVSTQNIFTKAASIAVSGKVGIGAGVAVTNDHTKTLNAFDDSTINGNEIKINAANKSDLTNIAVGAASSGNVSVFGSVSTNNLSGETSATLNDTNITATKSLAVTASGDETINNYAGALYITGTDATVGASVSVNNIENTIKTKVTGGEIKVAGNDSITAKDAVEDSKIINAPITADLFKVNDSVASFKTNSTYKGFLVDAVSTNTLKIFKICGGAVGAGVEINTLDIRVLTTLENAILNSKNISVDAKDNKTINQIGVMITNVGEKIADRYESSTNKDKKDKDGTQVNTAESINKSNDAVSSNLNMVGYSDSNVKSFGLNVKTDAATAGKGSANGCVTNHIKNSTLNAANILKVTANGKNNFTQSGVAAAGSGIGASATGSIGITNFKYNTANSIEKSTLTARKNIDINTITGGTNKLNLATASVTGLGGAIGVGYIECFGANDNEDLRIGTIESKAGNVTIATKGNLVSAVTERQNPTNATQIENWKNAGIFNTWSQKELVNALNGNIFSKDPYTVDFAPTANIIANRVILDVGGNIGSTATAKTINYSNLNSEENLKLLANVRVRDLEQGSNSVTYTPHTPIGLTLRGLSNSNWNLDLKGTADDNINLAMADNKTSFYIKSKGGSSFYTIGNENADVTFIAAAGITSSVNTRIYAKNLTLSGGKGKDTIVSTGDSGIYKTGVRNDFITASGNFVTIDGGVGNDIININGDNNYLYLNSSKNSTIDTGAGNDYIGIDIENSNSLLIEVGSGGNDEIGGFSVSDTIKMAAAVKRSYVDGNDFVIEFNKGSVRVKDLCFSSIQAVIAQGELVTLNTQPEGLNIANKKNTSSIAGNAGADTITNSGNNFTITSGNGNDSVTNSGSNSQIITGRGNHTITNSGANTLTEGDNTSTVSYEFNGKVTNDLSGNSFKLAKGTAGEIMLNDYDFNVTALNSSGGKFISDNDGVTFTPDSGKMNI